MFNFFKRKTKIPEFKALNFFEKKDFYFIRTAEWDWMDKNTIVVFDHYSPRILTLDPWPQLIFIGATGQKTIWEYVFFMAGEYESNIPDSLDDTIINEIRTLLDYGIIELCISKKRPKPEYELPKCERNSNR